jgi:hypothetical protein
MFAGNQRDIDFAAIKAFASRLISRARELVDQLAPRPFLRIHHRDYFMP